MKLGIAGRIAATFLNSKLTPLFVAAAVLLGVFAVVRLPREEEPQIIVPMIDVFVSMPGASAKEVEERVTRPMEKLLREIPGVEYIYSTSSPGQSLAIVRFYVGEDEEKSIVRLNQKMAGNFDLIPPGASFPLVKPRSIDDVPILALTLWSTRYDDHELRRVAAQLSDSIKEVDDVSAVSIIGGRRRELRVTLDALRLAAYGISPAAVARALEGANRSQAAGSFAAGNRQFLLEAGAFLRTAEDVRAVVVGVSNLRPVFLRDVATVEDGGEEASQYVRFLAGAASGHGENAGSAGTAAWPAVTLAVSKRKNTNAITVGGRVLEKVRAVGRTSLPSDIHITITRHYGATAAEKSNELLFHMLLAVLSVSALIWLVLGRRESAIVLTAIPVTLALTLAVFHLAGYTLNRITLFALIFSIGILVDDAIVVVENIVRHARLPQNRGRALTAVAAEAVDEVGNPTILATLTVIAAILPMAFVGGLMGPYMRPIPVGASAAMVFSLIVALMVTPWAAVRLLKPGADGHHEKEDRLTRLYRRFMGPLIASPRRGYAFLGGVVLLLLASGALVAVKFVRVKMLPFDNKSEFQVVIDMPEGSTLEETARATDALAAVIQRQREVVNLQTYVGTAAPHNFNGLVRHYFLRRGPNVADIQVNMAGKDERRQQSHEIAKRVRREIAPVAAQFGARVKVAEVPPGPPVLQTLVAEIYGPDYNGQVELARSVRDRLEKTPGIVDVDWYVEDPQAKYRLVLDREKAARHGVTEADLARTLRMVSAGEEVGLLHYEQEKEDLPITVRLDRATRSDLDRLRGLKLGGVSIAELVRTESQPQDISIYHKNLMPVVYVTADVAGEIESPVYAILKVRRAIEGLPAPDGARYSIAQYTARQPFFTDRYSMKWDGEWHITYEVFRDLGLAFAAVLILIYILVVGWFQSFLTPAVIMAAIPFSLVGILPAHGLMNAFFTATSMIGFIAGAGIVVRNSIILVDFIELRLRQGMPLAEAVVEAGAVRFRPMLLTAMAVVVGSAVILFDPIFQGLALSLMAGEVASLLLSRMTVPVLYYLAAGRPRSAFSSGAKT